MSANPYARVARLAPSLLAAALLSACTGDETGSDGATHAGGEDPCSAWSSDPALGAKYDYTAQDVLHAARGTWVGRYPGGDAAGAFDITVTVEAPDADADAGVPEVTYLQPRERDGATVPQWIREVCVRMAVAARVRADASDPAFDKDFSYLDVRGDALRPEPFRGDQEPALIGVVSSHDDVQLPPSRELGYSLVFGSDGTLWIAIEDENVSGEQPARFLASGHRE